MSHPGSSKKKRVIDDDDDDLSDTGIEMADDCDIEADHNLEDSGLLSRTRVLRKKSCMHTACRICMGIMATAVFTFMLVQLWTNYGDDIKKRVFSPQVVGAGSFTTDGALGATFGLDFHKYENDTLHLNISKPTQDLIQLDFSKPRGKAYEWDEECLKIDLDANNSVAVIVWSI